MPTPKKIAFAQGQNGIGGVAPERGSSRPSSTGQPTLLKRTEDDSGKFKPVATPELKEWLDSVAPGLSRLAQSFAAAGYEQLDDLRLCVPSITVLETVILSAGAGQPQVTRIAQALPILLFPHLQHENEVARWLDGIKSGFSVYAPAMVTAGWHDLDDLQLYCNHAQLETVLTQTGAPPPHVARIVAAVIAVGNWGASTNTPVRQDRRASAQHDERTDIVSTVSSPSHAEPAQTDVQSTIPEAHSITAARSDSTNQEADRANLSPHSREDSGHLSLAPLPVPESVQQPLPVFQGKHAMLSYQWDSQSDVLDVRRLLEQFGVPCWLDVDHMGTDIYDSMAEGVQGAAVVVCFMTPAYQNSTNCKLELKFAKQSGVPIVPVMLEGPPWKASGWLGLITAGSLWVPLFEAVAEAPVRKLVRQMEKEAYKEPVLVSRLPSLVEDDSNIPEDGTFSVSELRNELERLRVQVAGLPPTDDQDGELCALPEKIPDCTAGIVLTPGMEEMKCAVLQPGSREVGLLGIGGVGKTTVSSWIVRQRETRQRFEKIAWITLGQTPNMENCIADLHAQLTGRALQGSLTLGEKEKALKEAFHGVKVLLMLDDVWDRSNIAPYVHLDPATDSKIVISTRLQGVLEGSIEADVHEVIVPSEADAIRILMTAAGLDPAVDEQPPEAATVAHFCNKLPLVLGIAGKQIRQMLSNQRGTQHWDEIPTMLEREFAAGGQSRSVVETVIQLSLNSIASTYRAEVVRLFNAFAIVAEDTSVPLEVLGMVYVVCTPPEQHGVETGDESEPSRLSLRRWLKVLIDRSLVVGSVDRPQLHDVVRDFVMQHMGIANRRQVHRRFIALLRTRRPSSSEVGWGLEAATNNPTAQYVFSQSVHHVKSACEFEGQFNRWAWQNDTELCSWLDDHIDGSQDAIPRAAAVVLGEDRVRTLASTAEAAGDCWRSALRLSLAADIANGLMGIVGRPNPQGYLECIAMIERINLATAPRDCTTLTKDMLLLYCWHQIVTTWDGEHIQRAQAEQAKLLSGSLADRFPIQACALPVLSGSVQYSGANENYRAVYDGCITVRHKYEEYVNRFCDDPSEIVQRRVRACRTASMSCWGYPAIETMPRPGWTFDPVREFGDHGSRIVEALDAFDYATHTPLFVEAWSVDWTLTSFIPYKMLYFGDIATTNRLVDQLLPIVFKFLKEPDYINPSALTQLSVLYMWPKLLWMLGRHDDMNTIYNLMRIGQSRDDPKHWALMQKTGVLFCDKGEPPLSETKIYLPQSFADDVAACRILFAETLDQSGRATLEELAAMGGQAWALSSMAFPSQSLAINIGYISSLSVAWALEKYNKWESALDFARQAYETDLTKAGSKKPDIYVQAHVCAGRVLTKLGRSDEAATEFELAIRSANPPLCATRFVLYEALVLRDYIRSARPEYEWNVAELQERFDAAVREMPTSVAELDGLEI